MLYRPVYTSEITAWTAYKSKIKLDQPPEDATLQKRFEKDYYANWLIHIQGLKAQNKVTVRKNMFVHTTQDDELLNTGPLVLLNREPFACSNLTDKLLDDFESTIIEFFQLDKEVHGFSVCIYATTPNCIIDPELATICIGAKIDENRFIDAIEVNPKTRGDFIGKYGWQDVKRQHQ